MKINHKPSSDFILGVMILVVFLLFAVAAAAYKYWPISEKNLITEPLSQEQCKHYANMMDVDWKFDREFGCLVLIPGTLQWISLGEHLSLNDVLSTAQP